MADVVIVFAVVGGGSLSRRFDGPPTNEPRAETTRRGSTGVERPQLGLVARNPKGGGIPTDQRTTGLPLKPGLVGATPTD